MRVLVSIPFASLVLVLSLIAAGCGDGDASSKDTRAKSGQRSSAGSMAGAGASAIAGCLGDAGFETASPSHGAAGQWRAPDGTVVARSADPNQVATVASEIGDGEVVGDAGYAIAGDGPLAAAARTCVTLADA